MKATKTTPRSRFLSSLEIAPEESWRTLFYAPRAFKDYGQVIDAVSRLAQIEIGNPVTFSAKFDSVSYFDRNKKPTTIFNKRNIPYRADVWLTDRFDRKLKVVSFGNVWQWHDVAHGAPVMVHGLRSEFNGYAQIESPQRIPAHLAGKVMPVYPSLRSRVTAEDIQAILRVEYSAGDNPKKAAAAMLSEMGFSAAYVEARTSFSPEQLLRAIHRPQDLNEGARALDCLTTLTADYIRAVGEKASRRHENPRARLVIDRDIITGVIKDVQSQFSLTADQKTAIREILVDIVSPYPANRLLSGDVGTGKTLTFLLPAMVVARAGYRSVIMAPNELISRQIADDVELLCPDITVQVVNSKTKKIDDKAMLIGTTALLSRIKKDNLAVSLMVVDEQHKFSREQRETIRSLDTNFVEATATAIPRTMALVTHAGMQVSTLRERPKERTIHSSVVIGSENRSVLTRYLCETLSDSNAQVAIVYAAVAESETKIDVCAAGTMWEKHFPGKVAILHGKMKSEAKAEVIRSFRDGEKQLLVCSSVIEVGVSLPSLKGIIVVNAECYGAAQLHQLRGRTARNGGEGHAFFFVPGKGSEISPEIIDRLNNIAKTDNGFDLAEIDMEERGFGDLDAESERQNGTSIGVFMNIKIRPSDLADAKPAKLTSAEKEPGHSATRSTPRPA